MAEIRSSSARIARMSISLSYKSVEHGITKPLLGFVLLSAISSSGVNRYEDNIKSEIAGVN